MLFRSSALAERVDDVAVVDDFVTDVDGGAVAVESELDDLNRAHDAGAKSSRSAEYDFHWVPRQGNRRSPGYLAVYARHDTSGQRIGRGGSRAGESGCYNGAVIARTRPWP